MTLSTTLNILSIFKVILFIYAHDRAIQTPTLLPSFQAVSACYLLQNLRIGANLKYKRDLGAYVPFKFTSSKFQWSLKSLRNVDTSENVTLAVPAGSDIPQTPELLRRVPLADPTWWLQSWQSIKYAHI